MKQQTLAVASGFERYGKKTRRAPFLEEMEQVVPWAQLRALIEPVYAKAGNGRPPVGADAADLLFAAVVQPVRSRDGRSAVRLGGDAAVCGHRSGARAGAGRDHSVQFRHLLEEHGLGKRVFERVGEHLQQKGLGLRTGTIVDATIVNAPSSTKNAQQERDPAMHQTRKGKQWYFGMKAHVGVDSETKLIHSVVATAANVADAHALPYLLHGEETRVWGDQAYRGDVVIFGMRAPRESPRL